MSRRRLEGSMRAGPLETPGPKVLKDEGLVYTILMCLSLREARHLWRLRRTFFKVLKDKAVPLLALAERDWSVVRVFMDSGAFRYNLDSVFTEAVLDSDFEGLRMLAERTDGARTIPVWTPFLFIDTIFPSSYFSWNRSLITIFRLEPSNLPSQVLDARFVLYCGCVAIIMQQALRKGYVDKLSLLRSLRYDLDQEVQLCLAKGGVAEQLLSEGSITVDFLGSRNSFRFSMLDRAIHSLCKHRIYLYKVPFVLSSFLKAGAATNAFLQVDSCGYLLLLALAAESFNFVYLLVQEAVNLQEVLARYSSELLQMVSKAMGARPGDLCESDVSDEQTEGTSSTNMAGAIRSLAEIDRPVLELHFQSQVFLDYAGELMSNKEFVQMRHLVEVHPFAFKAYFEENYKAMEDFETLDDGSSRQIALIVDLTSLHLPIAPFLESHQEELDTVLQQSWFASKAWTELVMLRLEVRAFDFASFFRRTSDHIDFAVIDIIKDGYWFDLHKLAQLDFDFDQFFDRRFAEVSSAVMQFMTMMGVSEMLKEPVQ
eukprot:g21271.t1